MLNAYGAGRREKATAQNNEGTAIPSSLNVDNLLTRDRTLQHVVQCRGISGFEILKRIKEAQSVIQGRQRGARGLRWDTRSHWSVRGEREGNHVISVDQLPIQA